MRNLPTLCLTAMISLVANRALPEQRSEVGFNESIRPLLSEYCFQCHGPDSASRKAELRLDRADSALESGAVVPGKAAESELVTRIFSTDKEVIMPPPGFGKKLQPADKKLLRDWINAGAKWEKHWAFIKPQRPALPVSPDGQRWARNPIDLFLYRKMTSSGLKPNAEADRYTLARRAAFDLTGLPPSPSLLRQFVADTHPNAFARFVEKLLASQHAGEHRARFWLDAARYGDTHGMHVYNYREIWPYRDWVVRAFNRNMPFDQFLVEQLAGDLLPGATLEQQIATGFSRCNITTSEGGAIPEELNVRYMVDRVETTATVFLGLTAGCAVCHDHKYDPIRQREFYQLGAFFNNTTQPAMDGNQKDTPPVATLPAAGFANEWRAIRRQRQPLRRKLTELKSDPVSWWKSRKPIERFAEDELVLHLPMTAGEGPTLKLPKSAEWAEDHPAGKRGVRFKEKGAISVPLPALRTDQPFSVSFWFRTPDRLLGISLFDQTSKTKDEKTAGWKITGNTQGGLQFEFHDGQGKRVRGLLPGDEALQPHTWQHVCVRYSGGQSNSSISILVNGRVGRLRNSTEDLMGATQAPQAPLRIGSNLPTAALSDLRIFRRWVSDEEVQLLGRDHELQKLLRSSKKWSALSPSEQQLATQFQRVFVHKNYRGTLRKLSTSERRRDYIYSRSTTTLVMQELPTPARAWVLRRGEYDQRGEQVTPDIPQVLNFPGSPFQPSDGELPNGQPARNRLDLARWLVHRDHPLTARVMVNRLWQSVFGTGIVKTSEDFGVMGDRPSHPELLDWLAVEFMESGWNVNHIMRLILTSAAYRQDSKLSPDKLKVDAANRLLAHGPRLRLDAEALRDQALEVGGLLRTAVGGPSVKPYQPAGLWNVVAITGSNTRYFKKDSGEALYRRSLYTFWKRTSPPPSMAAFNAPTREQCTVRRERTNTPLQALVLMNDPQFVEAARSVAENALRNKQTSWGLDAPATAAWMLTAVLRRPADKQDTLEMAAAAKEFEAVFRQHPKTARALINTGDSKPDDKLDPATLAAWTMVANALMNRDDFVTK